MKRGVHSLWHLFASNKKRVVQWPIDQWLNRCVKCMWKSEYWEKQVTKATVVCPRQQYTLPLEHRSKLRSNWTSISSMVCLLWSELSNHIVFHGCTPYNIDTLTFLIGLRSGLLTLFILKRELLHCPIEMSTNAPPNVHECPKISLPNEIKM